MSNTSEIGDVVIGEEMCVEWKVGDFFSLSHKVNSFHKSPVFSFAGAQWYLRIYPNGQTEFKSESWMSLYLFRKNSGLPQIVYFTLGIKGSKGEEKIVPEDIGRQFPSEQMFLGHGFTRAWSRLDLKNREDILLPNNTLTVTCHLRSNIHSCVKSKEQVLNSLLGALESGEDSDTVIKVQGTDFPVHRVILRARSPVFKSMFHHDMAEKRNNEVTIEDCDPETFQHFLVHLYTGSCKHISAKNVIGLFTIADKYDFVELKAACKSYMEKNLSIDGFCDVIALALRHNEQELIESATDFFCNNSLEIVKTVEWQIFLKENLTVGNELIIKTLSK